MKSNPRKNIVKYLDVLYSSLVLPHVELQVALSAFLLLHVFGSSITVPKAEAQTTAPLSAYTSTAPMIDGIIQSSEWANAGKFNITLTGPAADIPATLSVENDASNVYFSISVTDTALENRSLIVQFDDNNNGILEQGEESYQYDPSGAASIGLSASDFDSHVSFANSSLQYDFDVSDGGSNDGAAAATEDQGANSYEFSHPLCSTDTDHDFCLTTNETVIFAIFYHIQDVGTNSWPAGVVPGGQDSSNFVAIAIASEPQPAPQPAPPSDLLPAGTVIVDQYSPYPNGTQSFNFTSPGQQTIEFLNPSGNKADDIFVGVTTTVQEAVLYFESGDIQYHYSVVPDRDILLSFPQTLNVTNVKLTISDRGSDTDAAHVGYIVPEAKPPPATTEPPPPAPPPSEQPLPVIANAGLDQTVDENQLVNLDGSQSTASSSSSKLSYSWEQTRGPTVNLINADSDFASFVSPSVDTESTLKFRLFVKDSASGGSSSDFVTIFVRDVLEPYPTSSYPVANAGNDFSVDEGGIAHFSGLASDPDGDRNLSYSWKQLNGLWVSLQDSDTLSPSFVAPVVTSDQLLTFRLLVSDSHGAIGYDEVLVTIKDVVSNGPTNYTPYVYAGRDMVVSEGAQVTLAGNVFDLDGNQGLSYHWNQVQGSPIALSDPSSLSASFIAPQISEGRAALVFELKAKDAAGAVSSDNVTVTVLRVSSLAEKIEELVRPATISGAFNPPTDHYLINFTRSGTLVADLPPAYIGNVTAPAVGIWADIPDGIKAPAIHFSSSNSSYYYIQLVPGKSQSYLFENPLLIEKPTLNIEELQDSHAQISVGYYYEKPKITPITFSPQPPEQSPPGTPGQISNDNEQKVPLQQLVGPLSIGGLSPWISSLVLVVAFAFVGIIAPVAIFRRQRKRKTAIPPERQRTARAMAAILFPGRDPIAEEEVEKSNVMDELEHELGTDLSPAATLPDLLKRYTGEEEVQPSG